MHNTANTPELWFILIKSIAMLCIVIGIIIFMLFLIRRFIGNKGLYINRNFIKIISTYYLSPKERVILIDVIGEKLLIGVTSQNINLITKIDKEISDINK